MFLCSFSLFRQRDLEPLTGAALMQGIKKVYTYWSLRESSLHAPVRTNPTLQNCAAELASLKQSSHCLKAPFFNRRICCLPSRYRNHLRSKTIRLPHPGFRALIPASEPSSRPPSRDLHRIKHAGNPGSSPG